LQQVVYSEAIRIIFLSLGEQLHVPDKPVALLCCWWWVSQTQSFQHLSAKDEEGTE